MAILLFGLWIVLSGEISYSVCLTGAAVSVGLYLFANKVLGYSTATDMKAIKKLWGAIAYLLYLLKEMLWAGLVVMRLVYTKGRHMEPGLVCFSTQLMSDNARAALSDAITLTAGTITVWQEDDQLCIHTLDRSLAKGIEHSEFERRLMELEQRK